MLIFLINNRQSARNRSSFIVKQKFILQEAGLASVALGKLK